MADGKKSRTSWHPAFMEAIKLELSDFQDALEFIAEFSLTDEPLRIDCVVIKKIKEIPINKNIGKIFREANVLEYKRPKDYVSIEDFYKVYAYACLYVSMKQMPITSMTISFVSSRYPKKLVRHLKDVRKYAVEKTSAGIYTVIGDIVPIQLIHSHELSAEENIWLKRLTSRLTMRELEQITGEIARLGKGARVKAYLSAIVNANKKMVEEEIMINFSPEVVKVLEESGMIAQWEAKAEARGKAISRERTTLEIARNLLRMGMPVKDIAKATELPVQKIRLLAKAG